MNTERLLALFREGNPVPEPQDLASPHDLNADQYRTAIEHREDPQLSQDRATTEAVPRPITPRWKSAISVAVAIAVIVAGIIIAADRRDPSPIGNDLSTTSTSNPSDTSTSIGFPRTDTEATDAWLRCLYEGCEEPSEVGFDQVVPSDDEANAALLAARETAISKIECEGEGSVTCTVQGDDLLTRTWGYDFTSSWVLTVNSGKVTAILDNSRDDAATISAFAEWLRLQDSGFELLPPSQRAALEAARAGDFRESDSWTPPFSLDPVGEWLMLKGETWIFGADGTYSVADKDGVYETGTYVFTDGMMTITTIEGPCAPKTGTYNWLFSTRNRLGWSLVEDECGLRAGLLRGIMNRVE